MNHEDYMREALKEAEIAVKEGNAPFGAIAVSEKGEIVWRDHDRVQEYMDPTAHGEINCIRGLCKMRNSLSLSDVTFYTTSEPCATCLSALVKAKIPRVYYGAETEPTASLPIKAKELAKYATKSPIEIIGGVLANETLKQRESHI